MTEENILFKEVFEEIEKLQKKFLTSRVRCDNLDWMSKKTETSGNSLRKKFQKNKKVLDKPS